jgi:hypothetical protein
VTERKCAKLPRRMACAPQVRRLYSIDGEMSFAEFLIAMNKPDKEDEKENPTDVTTWATIMLQERGY